MRRIDMIRPAALDAAASSETLPDLAPLRRGGLFLSGLAALVAAPMALAPLTESTGRDTAGMTRLDLPLTGPAGREAKARIADVWASEAQVRRGHAANREAGPRADRRRIAALLAPGVVGPPADRQ